MPILWAFPSFLRNLESQGVDEGTIVRLTTFYELNVVRIIFRLLFVLPFVILGVDGVRPHVHVNENMFATDFLGMVSSFGCGVSSALTLVIFFPRSISAEYRTKKAKRMEFEKPDSRGHIQTTDESQMLALSRTTSSLPHVKDTTSFGSIEEDEEEIERPADAYALPPTYSRNPQPNPWRNDSRLESNRGGSSLDWSSPMTVTNNIDAPLRPNRRFDEEAVMESDGRNTRSPRAMSQFSNISKSKWVHPFVKNFRSPIDLTHRQKR